MNLTKWDPFRELEDMSARLKAPNAQPQTVSVKVS